MTTKRSKYDPLATSRLSRWLVLRDMFHNVLDATELPPGTDLRVAFADGLAALERDGWHSEGASGAMVFVRRGGERRLLSRARARSARAAAAGTWSTFRPVRDV